MFVNTNSLAPITAKTATNHSKSTTSSAITPSPKPKVTQHQKPPADSGPTKKATLTKQVFDPRFGANYAPLEIRFLTGACADQVLDLGFNIKELSMSQSANWEKGQGQTIQVGHNFVNISPWSFNLSWEYWVLGDDVHQLALKSL